MLILENNKQGLEWVLDKYVFPDYSKYENSHYLFHGTRYYDPEHLKLLSNTGLKVDFDTSEKCNLIWACDNGSEYKNRPMICFKKPTTNCEQVNDTQYIITKNISPSDIVFIDPFVFIAGNTHKHLSDIPSLIKNFGVERVEKVFNKPNCISYISFKTLFDYCNKNNLL